MKRYFVELRGEQEVLYLKTICVEVPDDASMDEVEEFTCGMFDEISPQEWKEEYTSDVSGCCEDHVDVITDAVDTEPDCRLRRGESGHLILEN